MAGPNYAIIPNDWQNLEYIIADLTSRIINEDRSFTDYILKDGSRAFTGVVSGITPIATANFTTKGYVDTAVASNYCFKTITGITNDVVADSSTDTLTLASANARLTIVGTTATDTITFTTDTDLHNYSWTNVDATDLKTGSVTQAYHANLASLAGLSYASTSFVKMTGANTFSLDTTVYYKSGDSPTFANITDSGLTATRIPYASTGGLLVDSANLIYNGSGVVVNGYAGFGELAGSSTKPININYAISSSSLSGLNLVVENTRIAGGVNTYGLGFNALWKPSDGVTGSRTMAFCIGSFGSAGLNTTNLTTSGNTTITECMGFYASIYGTKGGSHTGNAVITKGYCFYGSSPTLTNVTLTNAYGLYLEEITAGSTLNYAIYSAGGNSIHAGNFRIGGTIAPTNAISLDLDDYIDFGDNAVKIGSDDDGYLDLTADTGIRSNGSFFVKQINDAGMDETNGTEGEIVYNLADDKFYGCIVTGTPATWAAFN